jgi:hypothetical protein
MQFESMIDNKYFNIRLLLAEYIETQKNTKQTWRNAFKRNK